MPEGNRRQGPTSRPLAGANPGIRPITRSEFERFRRLIEAEAGIHLAPWKRDLLVGRLMRRLRALGLTSFGAYYHRITDEGDAAERVQMVDAICTNETSFFREAAHYELLGTRILPAIDAEVAAGLRPRRLRVWSAACATGEEPYSLAMYLRARYPDPEAMVLEIHATDLSTKALDRARAARWPRAKADRIPKPYLKRFMLRGVGPEEGRIAAGAELRSLVHFHPVNLVHGPLPVRGAFDLVFCCNVLIYFGEETRRQVVHRLADRLAPRGVLFVGHAESLAPITDRLRILAPTAYTAPGGR